MTDRTVTSGRATPSVRVWIEYATVGALAFQAAHLVEHAAQLAYWFMNPTHAPWLTPWAESGQNLLVVDGTAASGSELLHLTGNLIFMAGIAGMWWLAREHGLGVGDVERLGAAVILQGIHVLEHSALTASYLITGKAVGVSTLFGAAGGPFGSSLRVWSHFLLNLGATWYAYKAARFLWGRSISRGAGEPERQGSTAVSESGRPI